MDTFISWFCVTLAYSVMAFFGFYLGLFHNIWMIDISYMTSVIGAVFIATVAYLGFASWRLHQEQTQQMLHMRLNQAKADVGIGRAAAYIVTLIGLLGTAIGLMSQVKAITHLDITQASNISGFVSAVGSSLGTALYATCAGIVASIGILILVVIIEYYLDLKSASR